jgi:hypothetical protein
MQRCIQHSQLLLDFNHRFDSLERCSNGTPFFTGYALGLVHGKESAAGKTFWDNLHSRISMELGLTQPFANLLPAIACPFSPPV